jgi:hypothetical protein
MSILAVSKHATTFIWKGSGEEETADTSKFLLLHIDHAAKRVATDGAATMPGDRSFSRDNVAENFPKLRLLHYEKPGEGRLICAETLARLDIDQFSAAHRARRHPLLRSASARRPVHAVSSRQRLRQYWRSKCRSGPGSVFMILRFRVSMEAENLNQY